MGDLGGSEKVSKSRANEDVRAPGGFKTNGEEVSRVSWEEYYQCRQRITETTHINKGLLTLKRCVARTPILLCCSQDDNQVENMRNAAADPSAAVAQALRQIDAEIVAVEAE